MTITAENTKGMKMSDNLSKTAATVRVWDPVVRVFHWGLVATFGTAWLTAEEIQPVHEIAGYAVAGLVGVRLIWGVIGSRNARFANFVKGPKETLAYLGTVKRGTERRYLGHNPAGAAMIVALLLTLSATALTGWMMAEPDLVAMMPPLPQIAAPAWADEDEGEYRTGRETDGPIKEVHEVLANLLFLLAALHVGGVVLASVRHRENLARAMVTGEKRAPEPGDIA